jgi:pimeloyl-ACP methyl ester carboxylesterase
MTIKRGYVDGPFGQIHLRRLAGARANRTRHDLYLLHPAPFSGLAYTTLMPHLAATRRVIAPDYPGYGGSDPHVAQPLIEDYAKAIWAVMTDISGNRPVDVVGFHTGCLVAAQLSLDHPLKIAKAVMIDVPAFPADTRAAMLEKNAAPFALSANMDCLSGPWTGLSKRLESSHIDRAFELFVEQLRPGVNMNAAFHAAFSYPWEERLRGVNARTLVLTTQSPLLEGSKAAANLIPGAKLLERLNIARSVLDEAAAQTAVDVMAFLDQP